MGLCVKLVCCVLKDGSHPIGSTRHRCPHHKCEPPRPLYEPPQLRERETAAAPAAVASSRRTPRPQRPTPPITSAEPPPPPPPTPVQQPPVQQQPPPPPAAAAAEGAVRGRVLPQYVVQATATRLPGRRLLSEQWRAYRLERVRCEWRSAR